MAHREKEAAGGRAGRRSVPHTADLRVEAWAPGREECLAQAVRGMVEAFVDVDAAVETRPREAVIGGERDEDLLVALLDEVIYRLDAEGEVPVGLRIEPAPGGLKAVFAMAEMAAVPQVGAAPKAVTLHGLSFGRDAEGFACSVTLDV